jgi:hypothetical protein
MGQPQFQGSSIKNFGPPKEGGKRKKKKDLGFLK